MIDRQPVNEQIRVPIDQGGRGLELASLAFDQGSPGVVELGLTGGATSDQGENFMVQVFEGLRKLVRLERSRDRERGIACREWRRRRVRYAS